MVRENWHHKKRHWRLAMGWSFIALIALSVGDIIIGPVDIPIGEIFASFGVGSSNATWQSIVIDFRVPKVLTAISVGIALSICGLQMQTLFRNALAGPFVLGISSGASLGVAILIMGVGFIQIPLNSFTTVTAACLGALLIFMVVLLLSYKVKDTTSLLIVGLMFGAAVGAVVSILQYFGNPDEIQTYLVWTFGSLTGVNWSELSILIPIVAIGFVMVLVLASQLNIVLLGDQYALSSGINLNLVRYMVITITSLLAGTITAFCGPIAFIGIAVPHISRLIFNTSDHRQLVPLVALTGASVMLVCDILSQLPGMVQVLPINAVTSIFGAPLIIWLIVRRKNLQAF